MGITLSQITDQTANGEAQVGEVTIHYVFYPYKVTADLGFKLDDDEITMIDILSDVLESWDIVSDDGGEFPPTVENLKKLPLALHGKIADSLLKTNSDAESEGNGSFASS